MRKLLILLFTMMLSITFAQAATLTCQQISDATIEIPQFSSSTVEIRCTASGGTVSNIQITPNSNPGSGITITNTQAMSSSISDTRTGTAKWSVTGESPNTYTISYQIVSSGTNAWTGAQTTGITVPGTARLTVDYVLPPAIFTPTVETLDIKITNIGGTQANNIKLQLNDNAQVTYPTTIEADAMASFSWTNETGFNESGTYTTKVYIGDVLQDSATVTVNAASQATNLTQNTGWNLISLPRQPEDLTVESVLSGIMDNLIIAWGFNASYPGTDNEKWISYNPEALDPDSNTLQLFDIYSGYWIRTDSEVELEISGDAFGNEDVPLYEGWTLTGFPSNSNLAINDTIEPFVEDVVIIWEYDAAEESEFDRWKRYDPSLVAIDPDSNTLQTFETGKGYWFRMRTYNDWSIDNE